MKTRTLTLLCLAFVVFFSCKTSVPFKSTAHDFAVIAYYAGGPDEIDQFQIDQLTHIIFSFLHLHGNELRVDNSGDSLTIRKLVALKKKQPKLKILLSLGGWGGCERCSDVFSSEAGRADFARSLKALLVDYNADGIDLDWEYPAIEGYPGHAYQETDKEHFTQLVQVLRHELGARYLITFAAGGFKNFIDKSIEWEQVMPILNYVNVMTYDLVGGFSKVTGHQTPLFSTPQQQESVDYAVRYLDSIGVPRKKMVIGAAFYARVWGNVGNENNGLFQPGQFQLFVPYRNFDKVLGAKNGFTGYWDTLAQAPYQYNARTQLFATFDNPASAALKTKYALREKLGGIMFWQLGNDLSNQGMLQAIHMASTAR